MGGLDPSLTSFGMSRGTLQNGILNITSIMLVSTKEDKSIKYKNERDLVRAIHLMTEMRTFFEGVNTIYVELPVGSQSARAMASYGICVGVVAALGKRVVRVSAKDVKVTATGNPEATKIDMINWATALYPKLPWLTRKLKGDTVLSNKNEHVSDSIAAIHTGLLNADNNIT